jgi:polyphosphate kinase 2
MNTNNTYTEKDLKHLNSNKGLHALLSQNGYDIDKAIRYVKYEKSLEKLQVELIKLQTWVIKNNEKVVMIFEGRDAAGKGGAIRRIIERLNPRHLSVVALPKPSEDEATQWYFQRYVNVLPKAGEIIFFDRSWYNRAVVEPVNNFCTKEEYDIFMGQVNAFEKMIEESGVRLVKMYMSISKREQAKRFREIKSNPLKVWKMSAVDEKAQELWDVYTEYKKKMFDNTKNGGHRFKVIKANRKTEARIAVIKHLLDSIPYDKNIEV